MGARGIAELINRRRRQILVHSCIYYRLNDNIISDHQYDMWSKELAELQAAYPDIAETVPFADEFRGFDGSSGFDLPIHMPYVVGTAEALLREHKNRMKEAH